MATNPSQMIIRACQLIGELGIGDGLVSAQEVAYLSVLNGMMDSWSIDRLMVPYLQQDSFTLTQAQVSYTIGPAGNLSTTRPTQIEYAFVRDSSSMDSDIEILREQASYDGIVMKSTGNTYPCYLFYDNAFVSGLGTVKIYPAPISGLTLFLDSWKQLQQFSTITQALSMAPGYQRAIEFNLACDIAPGFVPIPPDVLRIAKESKAALKSVNLPAPTLRLDAAIVGNVRQGSSILTGP